MHHGDINAYSNYNYQRPYAQPQYEQQHYYPPSSGMQQQQMIAQSLPSFYHQEQPYFSTLNTDVIPDQQYLKAIDRHQPKFEISLLQNLCKQAGLSTPDERVYKCLSVMMEQKLDEILQEVGAMHSQSQQAKEPSSVHAKIQQLKQENYHNQYT